MIISYGYLLAYECSKELETYTNDIFLPVKMFHRPHPALATTSSFFPTHHHGNSYSEQQRGDVRGGGIAQKTQGGSAVITDDLSGPAHVLAFKVLGASVSAPLHLDYSFP